MSLTLTGSPTLSLPCVFQVLKSHLWLRLPVGRCRSDNHSLLMMAAFSGPSLLRFQGRGTGSRAGGSCFSVRLDRGSHSRPAALLVLVTRLLPPAWVLVPGCQSMSFTGGCTAHSGPSDNRALL